MRAAASSAATEGGFAPLRTCRSSPAIFAAADFARQELHADVILDHGMHPSHILVASPGFELARGFQGGPMGLDLAPEIVEPAPIAR